MAAKLAWQSEMVPPTPVIRTIDNMMMLRQMAEITMLRHSMSKT